MRMLKGGDVIPVGCSHWLARLGSHSRSVLGEQGPVLVRFVSWTCNYHLDSVVLTLSQSIFEGKAPF